MTTLGASSLALCAALAACLAACAQPRGAGAERSSSSSGSGSARQPEAAPGDDPCAPARLGLVSARRLAPWQPPPGCTQRPPSPGSTLWVRDEPSFRAAFTCPEAAPAPLDFGAHALLIAGRSLSPAGTGTDAFDDGAAISFVSRFRSPCPDDPRPMPQNFALNLLLPAGTERTFEEASCTTPPACR